MPRTQHGTQLNEIYKKQYLKSIGKNDASKKRKREEALEYIDEWIEKTYQTRDAERLFRHAESEWHNKFREKINQVMHARGRAACRLTTQEEINQTAEMQIIDEVGTREEYAAKFVENNLAPRGLLGVIVSIRDLLD